MVSNIVNLRPITIPSVKATVNALSPTFGTQKQWDRYMMKFKKTGFGTIQKDLLHTKGNDPVRTCYF